METSAGAGMARANAAAIASPTSSADFLVDSATFASIHAAVDASSFSSESFARAASKRAGDWNVAEFVLLRSLRGVDAILLVELADEIAEVQARTAESSLRAGRAREVRHRVQNFAQKRKRETLGEDVPLLAFAILDGTRRLRRVGDVGERHVSVGDRPREERGEVLIRLGKVAEVVLEVIEHEPNTPDEGFGGRGATCADGQRAEQTRRGVPVHLPAFKPS